MSTKLPTRKQGPVEENQNLMKKWRGRGIPALAIAGVPISEWKFKPSLRWLQTGPLARFGLQS